MQLSEEFASENIARSKCNDNDSIIAERLSNFVEESECFIVSGKRLRRTVKVDAPRKEHGREKRTDQESRADYDPGVENDKPCGSFHRDRKGLGDARLYSTLQTPVKLGRAREGGEKHLPACIARWLSGQVRVDVNGFRRACYYSSSFLRRGASMGYIDLRSDTVTKPTDEMREAMARAEVGDDVYLEDPTVNRLQEIAAAMLGKEAALFVASGTMGNQVCVNIHTRPGHEVILEERSHIFNYEMGAMAVVSGALPRPVRGEDGILDWPSIEAAIRPRSAYYVAQTGLVALENSHNMAGGAVMSLRRMEEICEQAHAAGLPVHLDGARIFNAAIALGCEASDIARPFDSVMFCLSKGLGAPIGSIIVGSRAFIDRALSVRRMFGGSMRQVGVIAAPGIVALEKMTKRLSDDHANAQLLARGLAETPGIKIDPEKVPTNILVFDVSGTGLTTTQFSDALRARGVLANGINEREMRMVTHKDVSRSDCESALSEIREILANAS
jgi:threonine aldolase